MNRPVDWSPLADSDPVGGDLTAVHTEATYYTNLAQEISDQVARLRKIAGQDDQVGKTADKLRNAAGDSADKIEKTHGRVNAVGEALTSWIPHLDNAQTDTLAALTAAQEAQQCQQANAAPGADAPPPKTDDEKSAAKARSVRLEGANADFAAAKRKFDDAVSERDSQADKIANHIKDALHDGLKDGFWDHIANWVSQHVALIKMVVEVLTWVATAVAIACIFIPGLNLLAIALTIGVLAGHTLLAATGNGSWVDVVIDVFALATLGAGRFLGPAMKAARGATLARAGELAGADASRTITLGRAATRAEYEAASSGLGKVTSLKGFRSFLSLKTGLFDSVTDFKAGRAAYKAETAMVARALPIVTKSESVANLGNDLAQNAKDLSALRRLYGDDAEFTRLARRWGYHVNIRKVAVGAGQAVDLTNHAISTSVLPGVHHVLSGVPSWEHFKEWGTHSFVAGEPWSAGGE